MADYVHSTDFWSDIRYTKWREYDFVPSQPCVSLFVSYIQQSGYTGSKSNDFLFQLGAGHSRTYETKDVRTRARAQTELDAVSMYPAIGRTGIILGASVLTGPPAFAPVSST